jgi:hypothetical protein
MVEKYPSVARVNSARTPVESALVRRAGVTDRKALDRSKGNPEDSATDATPGSDPMDSTSSSTNVVPPSAMLG